MHIVYVLSVWLHILAAATWVGGMILFVFVLVPVLKQPQLQALQGALIDWIGRRYRALGWVCLSLLVLSGTTNLMLRGVSLSEFCSRAFWRSRFGQTLAPKLLLVATILLVSAIHDFRIGPRATALSQADASAPETLRQRRKASWYGRINLILSLAVIALAVMLVRGPIW